MRSRLELPHLSLQERDRRWSVVRAEMKRQGLDCLLLCGFPGPWDFTLANARFLSPIAGNAAIAGLAAPIRPCPTSFRFTRLSETTTMGISGKRFVDMNS